MQKIKIIGGGLAGVEAAYQLAKRGVEVELYEMRPLIMTEAHTTPYLAELVCSNSLKSDDLSTSSGLLKAELRLLDSLVLKVAEATKVPSGHALSVDRVQFSLNIEKELQKFNNIKITRKEETQIDDFTIVASGPLTSMQLSKSITELTGEQALSFYDAVAPIIKTSSVNMDKAFWASRYDKGDPDYLNCPMDKQEYDDFIRELISAERVNLREFEKKDIFQACMPIEIMAEKGSESLRFGPLKPVGLVDSRTNQRAYAVVQLRKEDNFNELCNIVGFQTNLRFKEQERIFRMIPGLDRAEFIRYGVMHRNTFLNAPILLDNGNILRQNKNIYFAGQITGVEGYMESVMSGLMAGINFACQLNNKEGLTLPSTTIIGSLIEYLGTPQHNFQPMHANFSLMQKEYVNIKNKKERKLAYSQMALCELKETLKRGNYA